MGILKTGCQSDYWPLGQVVSMNYVASVGRDPAPAVLGYYFIAQHTNFKEIILIPEKEYVQDLPSTDALVEFLRQKSGLTVTLVDAPKDFGFNDLLVKLRRYIKYGDYVNITGGSKRFTIAMLMAEEKCKAITIDGHNPEITATIINKTNKTFKSIALKKLLTAKDYLDLYQKNLPQKTSGFLASSIMGARYIEIEGKNIAVVVRNNRPYVFSEKYVPINKKAADMRSHFNLGRKLAGSFSTPVYRYKKDSHSKHIEQITRHARAYRGIAIQDNNFPNIKASSKNNNEIVNNTLLDANKTTLIALVSDQVVPCLLSQAEYKAEQIYLLTSPEKKAVAQRLEKELSASATVLIVSVFSPDNPKQLVEYIEKLVKHHKAEVNINLNGGTSLMAVAAYLSKANTEAHYIYNDCLQEFNGKQNQKKLVLDMEIANFLAVHGFKLVDFKKYELVSELYDKAIAYIKLIQQNKNDGAGSKIWQDFKTCMAKYKQGEVQMGDANEYATYYELCKALGNKAKVVGEAEIEIPNLDSLDKQDKVILEPDALVLYQGTLLTVEVKNQLKKIFEDKATSKQRYMSEAFGGHFARSLIVCGRFGNYRDRVNNNRLEHLLNDDTAKRQLTIAIREKVDNWPQLETFPPENIYNPKNLFKKWGWI